MIVSWLPLILRRLICAWRGHVWTRTWTNACGDHSVTWCRRCQETLGIDL